MAGRGRAATLPAWATSGSLEILALQNSSNPINSEPGRYNDISNGHSDHTGDSDRYKKRSNSRERDSHRRERSRSRFALRWRHRVCGLHI